MESIQQLREQRETLALKARNLMDTVPKDQWTEENTKEFDQIVDEIGHVDEAIERVEQVLNVEASNKERADKHAGRTGSSTDEAAHQLQLEDAIFDTWIRGGSSALSPEQLEVAAERRRSIQGAMSTTTDTEGGYLSPDGFSGKLLEALAAYGGMRGLASIERTASGELIPWPTVDDTAQEGEIVGENVTVGNQEVTFGVKNIGAFKYSSKDIAVPFELLQDTKIDIEAYIIRLLQKRIARISNRHFTVGTGTGQPEGIVPAAAAGKVGATGQTVSIVYDDLVDLEHSVDPDYRASAKCGFMFHDLTLRGLKKLKDLDGRPIWLPGLAVKAPDTLLNYPYAINQHMAQMAANAKSMLFGDFGSYLIRDVMDVTLFRMTDSAYTRKGQVGFLAFSRHDGKMLDADGNSVKYYQNSAT